MAGYSYSDSWGLVLSGGLGDQGTVLDKVFRFKYGSNFEMLHSLPEPTGQHCLVTIDDQTLFFMTGGDIAANKTFINTINRLAEQMYWF